MSPTSLYAWQARFRDERTLVEQGGPEDAFLPVAVDEGAPKESRDPHAWLEIVTRSGRVVRVHGEPDERALRAVLEAAERC